MEGVSNQQERRRGGEQAKPLEPHIWAVSLADYNAGRLYGRWIDANQEPAELEAAVTRMLAQSPTAGAEEWAIFEDDDFVGLRIDEHEPLETVSQLAQGIVRHGPVFAAWADIAGREPETLGRFEEGFLGHWESLADYADQLFDDLGYAELLAKVIPDGLQAYVRFDAEAFGRDLHLSGDVSFADSPNGGVWLFDNRL